MEINAIEQLQGLMRAFGVDAFVHHQPYDGMERMDGGLRGQLYEAFDYSAFGWSFEKVYSENVIYIMSDEYDINYIMFRLPKNKDDFCEPDLVTIGPYITSAWNVEITDLLMKNQLPLYQASILKEYFNGIAMISSSETLESVVLQQGAYIFGSADNFTIERNSVELMVNNTDSIPKIGSDDNFSMKFIEERYHCEDELLEAIEQGNLAKAVLAINAFNKYRMPIRFEDAQRHSKNMMIVLNTLYRKAVQKADVHPAYIDSVSTAFAKRIEACNHDNELRKISNEMPRKYCILVRNHSLSGYSKIVQNALNYIDFNLTEALSLKHIAVEISVNASYLSSQFKRETNKTVTEYINQKRIHASLVFLATTDLPIYAVAEKVGIYDENYFSRLFKKIQNSTAGEYRNLVRGK